LVEYIDGKSMKKTIQALGFMIFILSAGSLARAGAPTLAVHPSAPVIAVGSLDVLQVIYDPDGADGPLLPVHVSTSASYVSNNGGVAAVSTGTFVNISGGIVLGVSAGNASITAGYLGLNAVSTVKVAGTAVGHNVQTPDGRTRSYLLYVPAGYTGAAVPLVINFHGYATLTGGAGVMFSSQMNAVADREIFAVAYPSGFPDKFGLPGWNAGFGWDTDVDDVEFARRLIGDAKTKININPNKIYATGHSNGGMLAQRLGCALSDQIAAIGCVGGSLTLGGDFQGCAPRRPVPLIEFHGTMDRFHPYGLAAAAVTGWLARNHISQKAKQVTYQNGIVTCETFSASDANRVTFCTANPPVNVIGPRAPAAWEAGKSLTGASPEAGTPAAWEAGKSLTGASPEAGAPRPAFDGLLENLPEIVYDGGGHSWPGGVWAAGEDAATQDISASQAMWDFFEPLSLTPAAAQAPALTVKAYPNPFRPNKGDIAVGFTNIPAAGRVRVYTVAGELVRDLPGSIAGAIYWDGKNAAGEAVASGVYTCLVEGAGETKKIKVAVQR